MSDGYSVAIEASDPCQDDSYEIGGVSVSNFVLPRYFDPQAKGVKLDRLGTLAKPGSVARGGYLIVRKDGQASQRFGKTKPARWRKDLRHASARRVRRGT